MYNGEEIWASSLGLGSVPENPQENSSPKINEKKSVTADTMKKPDKIVLSLADFHRKS